MEKKRKTEIKSRKKDAKTEIELLMHLYPDIKTSVASKITGRSFSLVSHILSGVKRSKRAKDTSRLRQYILSSMKDFNDTDITAFVKILSKFIPAYKVADILGTSINCVYDCLEKDEEFEVKRCSEGHLYTVKKKSECDKCPYCAKINPPDEVFESEKVDCDRFLEENKDNKKIKVTFTMLLTNAKNIVNAYYFSKKANLSVVKHIKDFRDVLTWIKYDCVVINDFTIPFKAGCLLTGINPYHTKEQVYNRILKKEKALKEVKNKSRTPLFSNIEDVYYFVYQYVALYERKGGFIKGSKIDFELLSDNIPFFTYLQP